MFMRWNRNDPSYRRIGIAFHAFNDGYRRLDLYLWFGTLTLGRSSFYRRRKEAMRDAS